MAHKTLEVVLAECQACCSKLSLSVHEVSDAPDASSRLTVLGQSLVMASCKAELGELPASSIGAPAQSRRDTASALSPSLMTVSSLSYNSSGEPSSCKEITNRVKEACVDEHFKKEMCRGCFTESLPLEELYGTAHSSAHSSAATDQLKPVDKATLFQL